MRTCNTCNARGTHGVEAKFVATDAEGLCWFECENHDAKDNIAGTQRTDRTPLDQWCQHYGIPLESLGEWFPDPNLPDGPVTPHNER